MKRDIVRVYLFRPQYVERIERGSKVTTIRAKRKIKTKVGDKLSLRHWLGKPRRSKQRIIIEPRCTAVHAIEIRAQAILVDNMPVSWRGVEQLAAKDGFDSPEEFFETFKEMHGLPFAGELVSWE